MRQIFHILTHFQVLDYVGLPFISLTIPPFFNFLYFKKIEVFTRPDCEVVLLMGKVKEEAEQDLEVWRAKQKLLLGDLYQRVRIQ
jgi:hypothetical protein